MRVVAILRGRLREPVAEAALAEVDAEAFAGRLVERDRSGDDRVSCFECRHYRHGDCGNYRQVGLGARTVGSDLARLLRSGFAAYRR